MRKLILLTITLSALTSQNWATGTWTTFDVPGAKMTGVRYVKDNIIAGSYYDYLNWNGFIYDGTTLMTINRPGYDGTHIYDIEGNKILGWSFGNSSGSSISTGFLYDGTTWTDIEMPGADRSVPTAIDNGNIVGYYFPEPSNEKYGYLFDGSSWTSLSFPGASNTVIYDLQGNNMVGYYEDELGVRNGFLYDGTTWTTLNMPGAESTRATGIYGNLIVGKCFSYSDMHTYGFLYDGINWTTLDIGIAGSNTYVDGVIDNKVFGIYSVDNQQHGFIYEIPEPQTYYVDADAPGSNNGSSWADAFNYLQDALAAVQSGDEIWGAQGTYTPDSNSANPTGTGDREATFQLKNGVAVKGGYAGYGQPDPNARDIELYETILSGDLAENDTQADTLDLTGMPTRQDNSIHVVTSTGTDETTILDGFTITAGNAYFTFVDMRGGGMCNLNSTPTINKCTFSRNWANNGGAMYNYDSRPTLNDCIFNENMVSGWGGGIYNHEYDTGCSPILNNCIFNNNSAGLRGGGICNGGDSKPTINNCTFSTNSADYGGGVYNGEDAIPTLIECTFTSNSAGESGGALYNEDCRATLFNCTFTSNSAGESGGGVYNDEDSNPTLNNCTFISNSTEGNGGGIYNIDANPTINNCIISDNSAYNGAGIYNNDSNPTLTNCTFSGNSASNGNALVCDSLDQQYPGNLQITNCIIWDGEDGIWNNDNSEITITYSDVYAGWPGMGNFDIDPQFVDPCNSDYHLLPGSPCIDAGDPCYVPAQNETDLDGKPRVINGRIDMGAYESDYIQARLWLLPRTINRQSKMKRVMAWLQLPEDITKDQIDEDAPLLLYPGPLEPVNQYIFEHGQKRTNIFILYDKAELMDAVPDNGLVDVQVIGSLNTSQKFYGASFVTLIGRQQPNQWRLLRKK
ncbi:MAG: right-handed parallel beta-helix repeat-containing protein [Planctomycetota bacterium]|jgi:predicted outer membrane repeat protein